MEKKVGNEFISSQIKCIHTKYKRSKFYSTLYFLIGAEVFSIKDWDIEDYTYLKGYYSLGRKEFVKNFPEGISGNLLTVKMILRLLFLSLKELSDRGIINYSNLSIIKNNTVEAYRVSSDSPHIKIEATFGDNGIYLYFTLGNKKEECHIPLEDLIIRGEDFLSYLLEKVYSNVDKLLLGY